MSLLALLADYNGSALFGGAVAVVILIWVLVLVTTVFWLWMLIDALTRLRTPNEKILWFLVIFFLHFIGALIYFFVARPGSARAPA
jgi:hypothetical protein